MIKRYQAIGMLTFLTMAASLIFSSDVQADATYNMVNDYRLYAYSEFRAKRQYDHTLQIRVTNDLRPLAERESHGESIKATDDTLWMYPVPEMLERILMREFALSFLFRKVGRKDMPSGLILELVLKSFYGYMQRAGFLTRLIYGNVAFSARLIQRKPRKTLFSKDYNCQTSVKIKPITKSKQHMVKQIAKSLEGVVPVLMTDIEKVIEEMRPPKRTRISLKKKPKPLNLEPIGPK